MFAAAKRKLERIPDKPEMAANIASSLCRVRSCAGARMSIQTKLLISMILIVLLPLSVTVVTWQGLLRMDEEIEHVIEEFSESRQLQPVDNDLSVALLALEQSEPSLDDLAMERLRSAEAVLLSFLAEQYDSSASEEHQAEEALHASDALAQLSELISQEWSERSADDRIELVQRIRIDIRDLYSDAESGVLEAPRSAQSTQRRTLALVLIVSLISALCCVLLSVWSTRGVNHRLRELHRNLLTRSETPSQRQPKDVAGVMTQLEELNERMMIKIEENNRELLRRERMAGIGLLAADVAHEINNPMNAMLGLSELSLRTTGQGPIDEQERNELHESLTVIRREVLRCRGIIERLMAMVRGSSEPQMFDASRLLVETVDVAKAARPDKASCFHTLSAERPIRICAPPQEVRQIMLTLLINAADAIPDDGRIEVDATRSENEVWLRVRDNGRGFTPQMQEGLFVPFTTNRAKEGGAGLGLSIANSLSLDIGAELRPFSDGPDQGSLFLLAIPIGEGEQ